MSNLSVPNKESDSSVGRGEKLESASMSTSVTAGNAIFLTHSGRIVPAVTYRPDGCAKCWNGNLLPRSLFFLFMSLMSRIIAK